jgi:hypothetical protein
MEKNNMMGSGVCSLALMLLLFLTVSARAQSSVAVSTGNQSPSINTSSTVNIKYDNVSIGKERLGKKIVLREAYLVPISGFHKKSCKSDLNCSDSFEGIKLYVSVQSIWPEPILLTSGKLEKVRFSSKRSDLGSGGENVIEEKATKLWEPKAMLLLPGEVKVISFARGFRVDGLMNFFTNEIQAEDFSCRSGRCVTSNSELVGLLNGYLLANVGGRSGLRVTLFEKDYQPLLTTTFKLTEGSDLFVNQEGRYNYRLQHDTFIGEVLSQIQGREESFSSRNKAKP